MNFPIDGAFIREIGEAYREVHKRRVTDLLSVAATDSMGDSAIGYLDAAMALAPREFEIVMREKMRQTDGSFADRANAACLYLRGHERKLWHAKRATLAEARKLAGFVAEEPMAKTMSAEQQQERKAEQNYDKAATALLIQVATEGELLVEALDNGTPAEKLSAVGRWLHLFGGAMPADVIAEVNARLTPN